MLQTHGCQPRIPTGSLPSSTESDGRARHLPTRVRAPATTTAVLAAQEAGPRLAPAAPPGYTPPMARTGGPRSVQEVLDEAPVQGGRLLLTYVVIYLEVTPHSRLVWTNEEVGGSGQVTTVTFEEGGGKTLLVLHDLYPSKEALDDAIASGSTGGMGETFEQLDELLVTLGGSVGRS